MFFRTPFVLPLIYPGLIWRIDTAAKEIFLSFDDGPVPGPTQFVLEQLRTFRAQATFFCIGDNIRKYPEVFKEVVSAGHAIGNHTFNHLKGWRTTTSEYLANIGLCAAEMQQHQITSNLFRPPYGRITRKQVGSLADYKIVMWDVLTQDYRQSLTKEKCLRGSIAAARQGSIVVFHDSLKADGNLRYVLPRFLEHFSTLGYEFKSL